MVWTVEEKAFCFLTYNRTKSFKFTALFFKKEFKSRNSPCKSRIQSWIEKIVKHGTVKHVNSKGSGEIKLQESLTTSSGGWKHAASGEVLTFSTFCKNAVIPVLINILTLNFDTISDKDCFYMLQSFRAYLLYLRVLY